ncbi:hypothetical protein NG895_16700 [Aeoliella sp. ICT_H6.2]|uniref:Tetratricopeptide repeat protein n=1 Tax=Aeoliella straminimaris TaxID=2954799 RepID=A0A9X2JIB7_9BACT|nr:hypothetical protein [Aeoliella straminimaris]MCO6045553.1 hypothetical protein [Aeoliella straminimaris]
MLKQKLLLPALLVLSLPLAVRAADDSSRFLDAMRARGHYDLALDFLTDSKNSRLVSDDFKKQIPYERGVTLLSKWQVTPSASERDRLTATIKSELSAYAAANAGTPRAADAQNQMAGLLKQMATRDLIELEARPTPPADAPQIKERARRNFAEARELYKKVEESLVNQLAEFPKNLNARTQAAEIDQRRAMRERLANVRWLISEVLFLQAETLDRESPEAKKLYNQVAEECQALYDKYDGYGIGFTARVKQGECYLRLGELKKASGCFEDVIVRGGDADVFRSQVTEALALQAEILLADKQYDALLEKQGQWLEKVRPQELRQPSWLELAYYVAEAKRVKAADPEIKDAEKRRLKGEAFQNYTAVAKLPGKYQNDARQLLATEFAGIEEKDDRRQVKTFEQAMQAAKDAINSMNAARQTLPAAKANNPAGVAALEEQSARGYDDAIHYLDVAGTLVDDDTPIAELNERRWLRCWLYWQDEEFYRSAVLAEFIARRYPEDPKASGAAQVALVSYQKLFNEAIKQGGADAGKAEATKLKDLASFITRRWGSSALADTAFGVLLDFSIRDKEFDVALDLVNQLPEDHRAVFQARIANAMWDAQLRAASQKDTSVDRAALRDQSSELMASSFDAVASDPAAADVLAASSLYLTLARLEEGDYQQAIQLLEDPQNGAIALSKTNNPIASRQAYAVEAYKAALRSYVSVVPPQTDKAVATMAELEKAVGGSDPEKLTRVYLQLGVQLQQQIKDLQAAGKVDEAKRVSKAFVAFLDKLNERGSSDPTVRQWIAQTYYNLAEGLQGDSSAEETRAQYYSRAADSYQQIVEDPNSGLTGNRLLAVKMQYAQTLRYAGKYDEAMKQFESILTEKEMMIPAQTAAAYTLQEWGAASDASKFKEALMGSGPLNAKGKPTVWGWSYISKVAISVARSKPQMQAQFKELFYEAWLNIARVSYLRSLSNNQDAMLKQARKVVTEMVGSYPELLKMPIREEYDGLLKSIQRAEGVPPTGLKELLEENN